MNRSSDPKIGAGVFSFASQGLSIALADPIGLYMQRFQVAGLRDPQGAAITNALTFVRQSASGQNILRAELAPPPGAGYTLDQCTLNGDRLRFGGQVARLITMSLFAVAKMISVRWRPRWRGVRQPVARIRPTGNSSAASTTTASPAPSGPMPTGPRTSCDLSDLAPQAAMPRNMIVATHLQTAPAPVKIHGRALKIAGAR